MDSVGAELGRTAVDSDLCAVSQGELALGPEPVYLLFTEVALGDSWCSCGVVVESERAWVALVRARKNKLIRRPRLVEIGEVVREVVRESQIGAQ